MSFNTIAQNVNRNITDARTYLDDRATTLVSPKSAEGIAGFVFDVPGNDEIRLATDVTDHVTENNAFINDHVVNKPIEITLTGFQGEIVFRGATGIPGIFQDVQNRLETVEAYLGDRTPGFIQQAQTIIGQQQQALSVLNQTLDQVQNIVGLFEGADPEATRQQQAYQQLVALRNARTPVTVQTPWNYFDSMIIRDISFRQGETTQDMSEISITLKEFRVAQIRTISFDDTLFPPRVEVQGGPSEDQGIIRGRDEFASSLFQGVRELGFIE